MKLATIFSAGLVLVVSCVGCQPTEPSAKSDKVRLQFWARESKDGRHLNIYLSRSAGTVVVHRSDLDDVDLVFTEDRVRSVVRGKSLVVAAPNLRASDFESLRPLLQQTNRSCAGLSAAQAAVLSPFFELRSPPPAVCNDGTSDREVQSLTVRFDLKTAGVAADSSAISGEGTSPLLENRIVT